MHFLGWTSVAKGKTIKKLDIKGRGRCGIRTERGSKLKILVRERDYAAAFKKEFKIRLRQENPPLPKAYIP
jgi:hypothetical protein